MIRPGEIYYADLLDAGRRPVLVVSRELLNRGNYAVIVVFTTAPAAKKPIGKLRLLPRGRIRTSGELRRPMRDDFDGSD